LLTFTVLAASALPLSSPAVGAELPDLDVKDLWDYPENLRSIVADGTTLFFICDPKVKECREGAVFIENRASGINEAGAKLVMLFRGGAAEVRSAALDMDLDSDIYIDEDGHVIDAVLDEDILPALLLVSSDGTVLEAVYGGGESLAGNIEQILRYEVPEPPPPPPAQVAEPEKKGSGRWKYILGAAAVIVLGTLLFVID